MTATYKKNMAAVSAVANPLAQNQDKVLLFQSGDTSYGVLVSPRDLGSDAYKEPIGPKDKTAVARQLVQPSQLVSMVLMDTISVYGITGDQRSDLQLECVSPVQYPLAPKPLTGALAGCSNTNGDQGWLYMISNDTSGRPAIIEWELSATAPDQKTLDCEGFSMDTNLYAVYDKEEDNVWLIYQKTDKTVVVFDTKMDKGYTVPNSASRVIDMTPLAAAIVSPDNANPKARRLVLYFIDAEDPKKKYLSSANALLGQQIIEFSTDAQKPRVVVLEKNGKESLLDWAGMSAYVDQPRSRVILYALTTKTAGREASFKGIVHPFNSISK